MREKYMIIIMLEGMCECKSIERSYKSIVISSILVCII